MATLISVELVNINGLAEDSFVNTYAVTGETPTDVVHQGQLLSGIIRIYNELVTTARIAQFLSPVISRVTNACHARMYDLDDGAGGIKDVLTPGVILGSPIAETAWTLNAAGGTENPLPNEVAMVCTLNALGRDAAAVEIPDTGDPGSEPDRPKQRRTGRVYIGPLNFTAQTAASSQPIPVDLFEDTVRGAIINADEWLRTASDTGPAGNRLGVWSRKDRIVRGLEAVTTDNAWDTVRRRGRGPTIRQTSPVPNPIP